jgi:hypothetical protein
MSVTLAKHHLGALSRSPSNSIPAFRGRGVTQRVQSSLSNELHADVRSTVGGMARQRMLRMDEVTARLIAHAGGNPAVAAAISLLVREIDPEITLMHDDVAFAWIGRQTHIRVGVRGWWMPSAMRFEHMQAIPETIAVSIVGRSLREIVSHPALDDMDLRIVSHERSDNGEHSHLVVEGFGWLSEDLARYL